MQLPVRMPTGFQCFATSGFSGGVGGTNGLAANGHDIDMTMAGVDVQQHARV